MTKFEPMLRSQIDDCIDRLDIDALQVEYDKTREIARKTRDGSVEAHQVGIMFALNEVRKGRKTQAAQQFEENKSIVADCIDKLERFGSNPDMVAKQVARLKAAAA